MTVAVAVVAYNARDRIAACLTALLAEPEAEVWVVDNASGDGTADLVARDFPAVRLVASEENLGFGRAVNLVAERTQAPWLASANDDVVVERGAIAALLAAARPRDGQLLPRLVLPDGTTQHTVHPFPSPGVTAAVELGLARGRLGDRLCAVGAWDPEREREVPWGMAAFAVLRREAFAAAGGFDAGQWMYAEDLSLGWRLQRAGWRTRYVPSARVRHLGGAATTAAFGDTRTEREMAATYAWLAAARGRRHAAATARVGWAAHAARAAVLGPVARVAPRYAAARDRARYWRGIHGAAR